MAAVHILIFVEMAGYKIVPFIATLMKMQRIFALSCGAPFPIQKSIFFPNSAISFSLQLHDYKKEMAMNILFHPYIPIHQINSPRTPYILVVYFVCKHV